MNDTYITFTGWVGGEVTLTETTSGQPVASFRVGSTPRRLVNGTWEDAPTAWYTVKAWRQLARNVQDSVRRGDAVVVHGRLTADVWTREDGQVSTRYVVVASSVGHDLARGTSTFVKAGRGQPSPGADESAVKEVIHSYDESGPNLDSFGEVVPDRVDPAA